MKEAKKVAELHDTKIKKTITIKEEYESCTNYQNTWDKPSNKREDLDTKDLDNPMMVAEYVVEIFEYLRRSEKSTQPNASYIEHQKGLNWGRRNTLVDWLIYIFTQYRLLHETLFLTINIVDRFLSRKVVELDRLQLVGITAMWIASKYEERYTRSIDDYCYIADNSFTKLQILHAERCILATLDYDLSYPNPMNFLRRISMADNYDNEAQAFGKCLMETSLLDHRCIKYRPSQIAAASMCLARKILGRGEWDVNLVHYFGYSEDDLEPIFELVIDYLARPIIYVQDYARKHFLLIIATSRIWACEHATSLGIDVSIPFELAQYEAGD
ncbi:hypothetical protein IFR05_015486 [Cadophora sp. M221]|nr:hypothetical protein IFR05_015486 [Cadophora sp. M221]